MKTASLLVLFCTAAFGQTSYKPPRTLFGQPDMQGVWDFRTITPLERPKALGAKAFFNAEEAAKYEHKQGGAQYPAGGVVPYNEFWYDRGNKIEGTKRTSLIVNPADGRLPPRTPEGQKRAEANAAAARNDQLGHPLADSWEDRPLQERCLMGFNAGPPMIPGAYNNNVQLLQTPDYVVILNEMIHNARIIPLDGRPHGSIRQWSGDSRGHWEGNTLVVDTLNFKRETSLDGSTANTHLIERFTRTGENTLLYEFIVDDPSTWTRPWSAAIEMSKTDGRIYEYVMKPITRWKIHAILDRHRGSLWRTYRAGRTRRWPPARTSLGLDRRIFCQNLSPLAVNWDESGGLFNPNKGVPILRRSTHSE